MIRGTEEKICFLINSQSSRYRELGGVDRVPRGELPADPVVAVRPSHEREHGRHVEAENTSSILSFNVGEVGLAFNQ